VSAADMQSVLAAADWADIALKFTLLTGPGIALAMGLKKFRALRATTVPRAQSAGNNNQPAGNNAQAGKNPAQPGPAQPGKKKRVRQAKQRRGRTKALFARMLGWLASVVTMLGVGVAGFGLVPLAHVVFELVSLYKWGPTLAGLAVVVAILAKALLMVKDLKDGRVDKPMLWLAPVPLVAMLIWVGPVAWQQATDQAKQTKQMMLDGGKDKPAQHNEKKHTTQHGGSGADDGGRP
jgi:hypothetical protein